MVQKVGEQPGHFRRQVSPKVAGTRLTREEEHLRERLSLALRHAMPEIADPTRWVDFIARETGIGVRRIERHMAGTTSCKLCDALAYFDFFGPDFEAQVRGKPR